MIIVDSSVWVDFFRDRPTREVEYLDSILGVEDLLTGDLVLAEVLQGFRDDHDFVAAQSLMTSLIVVEVAGQACAEQAARNYRILRSRGVTVRKTIDSLIATRCILDDLTLLYSDRDFDGFVRHLGLRSALPEPA
ncbi:type II toxin-antitoxin system VapC family toxin [Brevundimonas aurifodinae]|uniref:Ribonuclease VapC n=2 Tax=Brevundimonas TaxID=41275 RepID=A0ABV1NRT6_9CAUL|nr:MAG: VapC toxin family PIN domain ribonuclease [Brevundimonas sp. 12-68-7]OYX33969.1 MAG: VapC toxin family PIN domain ribonuclease [Brevundimonas subvibrioides]